MHKVAILQNMTVHKSRPKKSTTRQTRPCLSEEPQENISSSRLVSLFSSFSFSATGYGICVDENGCIVSRAFTTRTSRCKHQRVMTMTTRISLKDNEPHKERTNHPRRTLCNHFFGITTARAAHTGFDEFCAHLPGNSG